MERRVTHEGIQRPRRLLHVPSMTSVHWSDANSHAINNELDYSALSYTWGRFAAPGPRINVQGISWVIPSIRADHFTADEFQAILQAIAPASGYVWVDIACIDQECLPVKMDEIGKQGDIFRRAVKTYIWLTQHDTASLQLLLNTLKAFAYKIEALGRDSSNFEPNQEEVLLILEKGLDEVYVAIRTLLSDPWFSSLWTLQEAYLRDDALLLSHTGDTMMPPDRGAPPYTLRTLCATFQEISISLSGYASASPTLTSLLTVIEGSGLLNIGTSMKTPILIYPAAHFRTCQKELDRVYGIMQVYNLRLGSSQDPQKTFTLNELEDQLAVSLNSISPMAAQLFVHRYPPQPGKAWRVTKECVLPSVYYITGEIENCCSIKGHEGTNPLFLGLGCPLAFLQQFWLAATEQRVERLAWKSLHPTFAGNIISLSGEHRS